MSIFETSCKDHQRGNPAAAPKWQTAQQGTSRRRKWSIEPQRLFDVGIACIAIAFLAPLFILIWSTVRFQDGGPGFFSQPRLGRDGKPFRCLKFRTMVQDSDVRLQRLLASDPAARLEWETDHKLRNDPRITALGRFLRLSSLDELPQLINVVRGEMSLVGPRPIVEAERERYGRRFHHYAAVRPGITGLWQISGRNDVSYRRRVALDTMYVKRRTLGLYFRILILTIPAVLTRHGSY